MLRPALHPYPLKENKDPPYPTVFLFLLHRIRRIFWLWIPGEHCIFPPQLCPTFHEGKRIRVTGKDGGGKPAYEMAFLET